MNPSLPTPLPRRTVLAAGLATALGLTLAPSAEARVVLLRGMTGGGLARFDAGEEPGLAHFSLFASSMQQPDGTTLFLGAIRWIEAATGLRLESTEISQCLPLPDRTDGADIRGRMSVNGEGNYPFVIHAFDSGTPGSGQDAIRLEVNGPRAREGAEGEPSGADFIYEATAALVAGDMQWVIVDAALPE